MSPRRLPDMFEGLLEHEFPVRIWLRDEDTGEVLWEHIAERPGAIRAPSHAPRRVKAVIAYGDGRIEVVKSNGDKTSGRWK